MVERPAAMPAARTAATISFTGRVVKWAGWPPSTTGWSVMILPALSARRASSRLMATRSKLISRRPSAWPRHITMSGWCNLIRCFRSSLDSVKTTGRTAACNSTCGWPDESTTPLAASALMICSLGFMLEPANGSKPVSRTLFMLLGYCQAPILRSLAIDASSIGDS